MKINDFVDKIYCINLDKRKDRWDRCQVIFKENAIDVERFSAIDGKNCTYKNTKLIPGEIGIIRSNLEIVKIAKKNNYKSILIFEDDVELIENFNSIFESYIEQVPNDWEFIYLGGNHVGGCIKISNNVAKMKHSYAIHAIIIKNTLYDKIINELSLESIQVDVAYANLQGEHPSYVFIPHLAWQRKDFSDIQGGVVYYDFLKI